MNEEFDRETTKTTHVEYTEEEILSGVGKIIFLGVVAIIISAIFLKAVVIVGPGYRGVLMEWGNVQDTILDEGFHWVVPVMNNVEHITVQTERYSAAASAVSSDIQYAQTEVTVNYHLDPARANDIYQRLRKSWESRVVVPAIQEAVKASTAKYTAQELISKRPMVREDIRIYLSEKLLTHGLILEAVYITDFDFSADFKEAVENKVIAIQNAEEAKNDLVRIKIEAEQIVASAEAEAERIEIMGNAMSENPEIVSLEWVKTWNGVLPTTLFTGDSETNVLLGLETE